MFSFVVCVVSVVSLFWCSMVFEGLLGEVRISFCVCGRFCGCG